MAVIAHVMKPRRKIRRTLEPFLYLSPTIALLLILMVLPVGMVIQYSFLDNVIMNEFPKPIAKINEVKRSIFFAFLRMKRIWRDTVMSIL